MIGLFFLKPLSLCQALETHVARRAMVLALPIRSATNGLTRVRVRLTDF